MYFLYNIGISISQVVLWVLALFNPKIREFTRGRKGVFKDLATGIPKGSRVIWVHAASLGEFEQGLPVIESIRKEFPDYFILLTFFSPSGYRVRKQTEAADLVTYLPLDKKSYATRFIRQVSPVLAIFVKYEIWPNYLKQLDRNNIPAIVISAIFSRRQSYFKWYGGFLRRSLKLVNFFFVQNRESVKLLQEIGIEQAAISGDTRFDRVSQIRERSNELDFMDKFKGDNLCMVAGSTWPEDEEMLVEYINQAPERLKYVLAPHDIKPEHIKQLRKSLTLPTVLYSEKDQRKLDESRVLIVDTVGLLTKIYSYADIAYVGGGFATGLHNTLEPAVFGIPVIIGPDYHKFQEALDLVSRKGILVVKERGEFINYMDQLLEDSDFRINTGLINSNYITEKKGASVQIMAHLRRLL